MNLAKIKGDFKDPEHFFKSIVTEYFKYEEIPLLDIYDEENCLASDGHIIKLDVVEGHILLFTIVNRNLAIPIPKILNSKLSELLIDSHLTFPMKVTSLKDIIKREELSNLLAKLKTMISSANVSRNVPKVKDSAVDPNANMNVKRPQEPNTLENNTKDTSTGVGRLDVDPFAASPGFVGGYPPNFTPAAGGMIVGPDHPMFTNPYRGQPTFPAGPSTLPSGSVPPGARFDPISPLGPQPGFPNRPSGGFAPRPPNRRPPFGGDPDNDAFLPPGQNNFF